MAKLETPKKKKSIFKCENKNFIVKLLPFELSLAMSELGDNSPVHLNFDLESLDLIKHL